MLRGWNKSHIPSETRIQSNRYGRFRRSSETLQRKSEQRKNRNNLLVVSFLALPFNDKRFEFVFDMGCFHHVETRNRASFIRRC
jgi:hypothetical protein